MPCTDVFKKESFKTIAGAKVLQWCSFLLLVLCPPYHLEFNPQNQRRQEKLPFTKNRSSKRSRPLTFLIIKSPAPERGSPESSEWMNEWTRKNDYYLCKVLSHSLIAQDLCHCRYFETILWSSTWLTIFKPERPFLIEGKQGEKKC